MAPPRNRIARELPFEGRMQLCALKLDGATNEEVRASLRAAYPIIDEIGDNAYTAYLEGDEYAGYVRDRRAAGTEVRQLRTLYAALGADGDPARAVGQLARFEALKALRAALSDPEADVPRISAALAQLERVATEQQRTAEQVRIADLEAQLAALTADKTADAATVPTAEKRRAVRETLGLPV